jgi:hypothetical protein
MAGIVKAALQRLRYGKPIIVVSGLPRSGTSMAMKMLDAAGLELMVDGIRTADDDNPKGYFELEQVKDLGNETDKSWLKQARGKVIKIVSSLLTEVPASNRYKIIFMRRELDEVLASQAKMLVRRGETSETSDEALREMYTSHLEKITFMIRFRDYLEAIYVPYREVIENPLAQAKRINQFLGGHYDVEKMAVVVDSKLYRNRAQQ